MSVWVPNVQSPYQLRSGFPGFQLLEWLWHLGSTGALPAAQARPLLIRASARSIA